LLNRFLVLAFPDDSPEDQAYGHPQYAKKEDHHSGPGALSQTEHGRKYAFSVSLSLSADGFIRGIRTNSSNVEKANKKVHKSTIITVTIPSRE